MTSRGWIIGLAVVVLGCQDESIRIHHVPKLPPIADSVEIPSKMPAPADWKPRQTNSMQHAAWQVGEGDTTADVTITPLTPSSVSDNVNRWRGQLGLKPPPETEINAQLKTIEVENKS